MALALRWKITVAFTLLTMMVFLALDLSLQVLVKRHGQEQARAALQTQIALVQRLLPAAPWKRSPSLQHLVADLDRRTTMRLTLIAPEGTVVVDSREDAATMENHSDRPERLQALQGGTGSAIRHSATEQIDMLYVALAVAAEAPGAGSILRLARPLTEVRATTQRLQQAIWLGFVVAAVLVWLVSLLLSNGLTAPIHSLVRVARRVSRGDMAARVEGIEGPELGELATVFNSALQSLTEAMERLRREGGHWAAILKQMSDAVIIVDRGGRIEFVNPTLSRLFGLSQPVSEGRSSDEIALNYDLSALLQRAMAQNSVQRDEIRLLYPEPRTLAATVSPLCDERGEVIGAVGLLRDVTDLQRLEEVRREFVANASHELRTPAAAVKALAEALQMGALNDPNVGPRFVQQIVEAADRQTEILNDMLTLTRVERGAELLEVSELNAAEAFEAAARQIRPSADGKHVELVVEVGAGEGVRADAPGLHTILLNLLDNAVKYTPPGGRVTLRGQVARSGYEVSVSDTGIGIPEADQARVFERFYRVDKARDRATGGTGLGLSIVKHLVEAHGGRVSLRSAPGEGSTFTVFFPSVANGHDLTLVQ